jgi:dTDP-L-rhamnose 4-epimerase
MSAELVLVTGGAGFIGSWTVDLLLERGYRVRIIDNLQQRVHPKGKPDWVSKEAEFVLGDVAKREDMEYALSGVNYVIHLAAYQDYMPDFSKFIHTNTESSALIFELVVSDVKKYPLHKIVFASSQSVSGEGRYLCPSCAILQGYSLKVDSSDESERVHSYNLPLNNRLIFTPPSRPLSQLQKGDWELHCRTCHKVLSPVLIDEKVVSPGTTYAISKYAIEMLADKLGKRYNIPTACMRYTYVQGPRNSFYNVYSGIARRFAIRLMNGLPPLAYEDGKQLRDYVNVRDVAKANILAMEDNRTNFSVFNIGGGRAVTVLEFAKMMSKAFESDLEISIPGEFRLGDTRHTISDTYRMRMLGWKAEIPVETNVKEYADWIRTQSGTQEYSEETEKLMHDLGVIQNITRMETK